MEQPTRRKKKSQKSKTESQPTQTPQDAHTTTSTPQAFFAEQEGTKDQPSPYAAKFTLANMKHHANQHRTPRKTNQNKTPKPNTNPAQTPKKHFLDTHRPPD